MEPWSVERIEGEQHDLLDSPALSALLPPCPEWPDLN